jgi:hypothetical protein
MGPIKKRVMPLRNTARKSLKNLLSDIILITATTFITSQKP